MVKADVAVDVTDTILHGQEEPSPQDHSDYSGRIRSWDIDDYLGVRKFKQKTVGIDRYPLVPVQVEREA